VLTKADKTKQLIIEKAAPLFNKKGYAGTSMNDIMAATGLTKGGLYGNFDNKDEIAALAFEYSYNKLKTELVFKIKQHHTAVDKLLAILSFHRNYSVRPPVEGGCPLLNTSVDADDAYPFLKKRAKEALNDMLGGLQHIIQKGIEYGQLKSCLHARREAEVMFAQIEGGIMMAKVSDDVKMLHHVLDNLREHIETNMIA
jgi:TetR/AcrR family transcriptional regulator, transcriptional repressor for nem operon